MKKQKSHHQLLLQDLHQSRWNDIDLSGVPNDIIFSICQELPADTLVRFRWACKYWFNLIRDPSFVKSHVSHQNSSHQITRNPSILILREFEDPLLQLVSNVDEDTYCTKELPAPFIFEDTRGSGCIDTVGTCNGLVCSVRRECFIYIWNPCTNEYVKIYEPKRDKGHYYLGYGFGYDCTTDNYKVTCNAYYSDDYDRSILDSIKVHTLGTCSWTSINSNHQGYDYHEQHGYMRHSNVVFAHGALYWLVKCPESRYRTAIISFDVAKEEYKEVLVPDDMDDKYHTDYTPEIYYLSTNPMLAVWKGCLCMISLMCKKLWVLKDDGVTYSWTQLFNFKMSADPAKYEYHGFARLYPLRYWRNDEVLMATDESLILCDPQKMKATEFTGFSEPYGLEGAVAYIGSLVSLKFAAERRRSRRRKTRIERIRRGFLFPKSKKKKMRWLN